MKIVCVQLRSAERDNMSGKLKLTTANLEKISEKLKSEMGKCIGVVERKQDVSSSSARAKSDKDGFGTKSYSSSRQAQFDPAKELVKQCVHLTITQLKERNPDFSAWTATIQDLKNGDQTKLNRKQMILLARRAQSIRVNTLLAWLAREYPACFSKERPKPLKIGIFDDIRAVLPPKASRILLKQALKYYANTKDYFKALIIYSGRYDLSGKEVGTVTKEEKSQAMEKLAALSPKNKSKMKQNPKQSTYEDNDEDEEYDNRFNR